MKIHVQDENHSLSRKCLILVTQACLRSVSFCGFWCAIADTLTYMTIMQKLPFVRHEKQGYLYNVWTQDPTLETPEIRSGLYLYFVDMVPALKFLGVANFWHFVKKSDLGFSLEQWEFLTILGSYSSLPFWWEHMCFTFLQSPPVSLVLHLACLTHWHRWLVAIDLSFCATNLEKQVGHYAWLEGW